MAQSSDSTKAAAWRRRVRRFGLAGTTVNRFCEKEGVSAASFYRWRKKLAVQKQTTRCGKPTTRDGNHTPAFQTVRVTPTDAAVSIQLPGGAKIDVPTANLDAVRVVLGELLQHDTMRNRGESPC